jgi:hypothetical protein
MATPVNRKHVANLVQKTNRWVEALEAGESLGVPRALIALEASGPMGEAAADIAWSALANAVGAFHGKPETAPNTTRRAIADQADARERFLTMAPSDRVKAMEDALAGLPS